MGYTYTANGDTILKADINIDILHKTLDSVYASPENKQRHVPEYDIDRTEISIRDHETYEESDIAFFLDVISPFITEGVINCIGEDHNIWRFVFNPDTLEWDEQSARVCFDMSEFSTDELIEELGHRKDVATLVTTYSFDSDVPVTLFSSEEAAQAELQNQFAEELRIATEENGHQLADDDITASHNAEYSYAKIEEKSNNGGVDVTEWTVTSLRSQSSTAKQTTPEKLDAVFVEVPGEQGLSRKQIIDIMDLLSDTEVYPLEIENSASESVAMGFIRADAADKIDFEYQQNSLFGQKLANILADMNLETPDGIYDIIGLTVKIMR